jgi:DinB superfamily
MSETAQEYTKRILGYVEGKNPLKVQEATPRELERLTKPATRARMGKRPAADKWSVAEILAHLAEAEWVGGYRIRTILSADRTPIQAYDQDAWARSGSYAKQKPADSLALFRTLRQANLRLLKSLSSEQWKQYGIHAERGKESIERIARMFAGHDLNHLEQIGKILAPTRR